MASKPKNKRQIPSKSKKPVGTTDHATGAPDEDDSIIGTMFWRSLAIIAIVAGIGGAVYAVMRPKGPDKKEVTSEPLAPKVRVREVAVEPKIPLTDITRDAGIHFTHFDGKDGEHLLPETMGGGGGFFDFDNDGDQDILFVNSCRWTWSSPSDGDKPTMVLYQNDGTGKFTEVTKGSGLDVTFYGMGPAFGDFDNDGWVDVFITAVGRNHLFRNNHGTFVDVSDAMNVSGSESQWSCPAMWFDYDRDGKLDLLVGNYVTWSRDIDLSIASTVSGTRAYGQPSTFSGAHLYLYHNEGDRFREVGEAAGLHILNPATQVPEAKALGLIALDANHDGWPDVCVANDTVRNFMLINDGKGGFVEQGIEMGVGLSRDGQATGAMGIDCGFFRNDASCALVIGNFANEPSSLYLSDGRKPVFTDVASTTGFGPQTKLRLTFGVIFVDMDLDGRQDIVCANGHLEPDIQKMQPTQQFAQPPQLFWNAGRKQLTQLIELGADKTGDAFQQPMVGRGCTYADIDGDGDLDLLFIANGGPARLFRNEQSLGNHWLRVALKDKHNTGAIGAVIEIQLANSQLLTRSISSTRSYLSQVELTATFGLGQEKPQSLTITWPDGSKQTVAIPELDTTMSVEQRE